MKLHLPKGLLAFAMLACFACGSASALSVTKTTATNTIDTSQSYTGNGISYDAETGIISYNHAVYEKLNSTITLDYTALTALSAKTDLLSITSSRGSWGFRATGGTGDAAAIIGFVINGNDRTDGTKMSATDLNNYVNGTENSNIRVVEEVTYIDNMTALIDATLNNGNGSQLKTAEGTAVYVDTGLKYTPATIYSVKLDNDLISSITLESATSTTVSNASNSWRRDYTSEQVISVNTIRPETAAATIINDREITINGVADANLTNIKKGGDIIVGGGKAMLDLSTWSSIVANRGAIALENDFYLGSSTNARGALHLVAYSGTIDLSGNITLVENSKMTKERNSDNKNHWVTFSGDISDGEGNNYTLTLAEYSNSGGMCDYMKFTGNVDLGGLTLAGAGGSDITFSNAEEEKTVQIGTLSAQDGAQKVTFDEATTIGSLSVAEDSSLTIAGTGTVSVTNGGKLAATLDNTNANLSISGKVSADSLFVFDNTPDATAPYSDGENGYWQGSAFTIVDNAGNGAVSGLSQITVAGKNYTTSTVGGDVVVDASAVTDYFVNTTVDYNADSNVAQAESVMLSGGTLNLNTALSDTATIYTDSQEGAAIVVGDGVTLDNADVVATTTKATLSGSDKAVYNMGTVAIGNNNRTPNVTIGSTWYGTVVFASGITLGGDQCKFDIDDFANGSHSTVEFAGASGYLGHPGTTGEINANIKFTGDGLTLNDGYADKTTTFNGNFSGTGNWTMNADPTQTFALKGDMSQWSGELKQQKGTNTYNYSAADGKKTTIANKMTASGGTMKVNVNNSAAVSMTGDITADGGELQLTKTGGSTLTVDNIAANGGNVVLAGTGANAIEVGNMSIKAGNTVTGAADVTVTDTLTINSSNAINLTGSLVFGKNATLTLGDTLVNTIVNGSETSYTLAVAGSIGNVTLSNAEGWFGEKFSGFELKVQDYAGPAMLDGEGTSGQKALVLELTPATTAETLTEVNVMENGSTSYTDGVLTLQTVEKLADFDGLGDKLNVVIGSDLWEKLVADYKIGTLVDVALKDADGNYFDLNGVDNDASDDVLVTLNGIGTNNVPSNYGQAGGVNGAAVGSYVTSCIPEPTSTTLSLLALAALAARRRRR